jgi:hypothetical protein
VCGDGTVNQPTEACDGADAIPCPERCRTDCTCAPGPTCGDGAVNQASEACDGAALGTCVAGCRPDCTCIPQPVCGDGAVNRADEACDGLDDDGCPGRCTADCTCTPPFPCLDLPGPTVTAAGVFGGRYENFALDAGTKLDLRGARFLSGPGNLYPITLGGGAGVCVPGGTVLGQFDRFLGWDAMHGDNNNAGIAFENAALTVDGLRIDNVTDGIRPREGGDFAIRNVWLSYIRDDCIENDHLFGGLVEDSLFDGCFVGFSARPSPPIIASGYDGAANLWTIRRSLVRLEPMPGPPAPSADGLGHGGLFKWHQWDDPADSLSPRLALHDNVFLVERAGNLPDDRMGIPPGKLAECSNNVLVWLGGGNYPASLPPCFTLTRDRGVWDAAVADWHRRHAYLRD